MDKENEKSLNKLVLNKETVKILTEEESTQVAGGTGSGQNYTITWVTCNNCPSLQARCEIQFREQ